MDATSGTLILNTKVLVLNRSYLPIHITSVRRAFSLLYQGIARAVNDQYQTFDFDSWSALSVSVHDDSIGLVTKDDFQELYDTFEHGDPYIRRSGSGLGLALTRSLVELHGGSLEIRSEPDQSARAVVRFPVAGPSVDTARVRAAE